MGTAIMQAYRTDANDLQSNKHIILPMTCDAEFRVCSALDGDGRW